MCLCVHGLPSVWTQESTCHLIETNIRDQEELEGKPKVTQQEESPKGNFLACFGSDTNKKPNCLLLSLRFLKNFIQV